MVRREIAENCPGEPIGSPGQFCWWRIVMYTFIVRYLAIGVAGSVGAILRYVLATQIGKLNLRFPLGTFVINITGSMFLGWFLTYVARHNISDTTRLAIGVGFVGAYTTFSTFMYESNRLADEGAGFEAIMYLLGSLVVGIFAVRVGMMLAR
jgi:fluoride exporter